MAKGKKSFVLYTDLIEIVEELTDKEAGLLFKTILRYVNDKEPPIPNSIKLAFIPIKQDLKRDLKKYEAQCERINRINEKRKCEKSEQQRNEVDTKSSQNRHDVVGDNDNVNDNDNDNDNDISKEKEIDKEKTPSRRFVPPTLEEVKNYCLERNNLVDPEGFINFYESKGWMVGKNKMKDWKAAIRTWEKEAGFKSESNSNSLFQELGESDEDYQRRISNGGFNEI